MNMPHRGWTGDPTYVITPDACMPMDHRLITARPAPVADELLEVVGERLAAQVDAPHARRQHAAVEHRHRVREAEAGVQNYARRGLRRRGAGGFTGRRGGPLAHGQRRRRDRRVGSEPHVLEDQLLPSTQALKRSKLSWSSVWVAEQARDHTQPWKLQHHL